MASLWPLSQRPRLLPALPVAHLRPRWFPPPEANLEDDLSDDDEGVDQINTSSLSNGGSSAKKARTRGPTVQSRTVQLLKEDLDMRRKEMGQRHEDAKKLVEATLAAAEKSAAAIHDVASAIRYLADKN